MPVKQELARDSKTFPSEIFSVSALNRSVRDLIEHRYPLIWVAGEISNVTVAKSGHMYFVLKDESAQVRCVMFRNRSQLLEWAPREGMKIEARALVTLYEARGDFQLTVETMRRAGQGALFEAFLKLREKLEHEGLFDPALKRPPPALPRTIGIVTSPQAAALHDVLTTLARRNPSLPIVLYPAPVQGEGAAERIARAIETAGRRLDCDVLLLVRGGGSIEDLWAFNEEVVARAIRACPIPIVTGIGHETDFTIADFAADQRAPTPTAAAELVSPSREALFQSIATFVARLRLATRRDFESRMQQLDRLTHGLVHPAAALRAHANFLGQLRLRLEQTVSRSFSDRHWRLNELIQRGRAQLPEVAQLATYLSARLASLRMATLASIEREEVRSARAIAALTHLDPLAVLDRGYSIVEQAGGVIVRDSSVLGIGETVSIRFSKGRARVSITKTEN